MFQPGVSRPIRAAVAGILFLMLSLQATAQRASDPLVYMAVPDRGVVRVDSGGQMTTLYAARSAWGLDVDEEGILYFVDQVGGGGGAFVGHLMRMSPRGEAENLGEVFRRSSWGSGKVDVAAGPNGLVYLAIPYQGIIRRDPDGSLELVFACQRPSGIAVDEDGSVYFVDRRLSGLSHDGYLTRLLPDGEAEVLGLAFRREGWAGIYNVDLALDPSGGIYVSHPFRGILKYMGGGEFERIYSDGRAWGYEFAGEGSLFVARQTGGYGLPFKVDVMRGAPEAEPVNWGTVFNQPSIGNTDSMDLAVDPRTMAILEPGGGETHAAESEIAIRWFSLPPAGTGVRFELWRGVRMVELLGHGWGPGTTETTKLYLPLLPSGDDYRIRMVSTWDASYSDETGLFSIEGGTVRVIAPAGGQRWESGERELFHWKTYVPEAGGAVSIELWRNGEFVERLAVDYDPDGENALLLEIPEVPTAEDYRVRVYSLWNPELFAESDADVSISNDNPATLPRASASGWVLYR